MLAEALVCLALNVYHEARNQHTQGQEAVAHVVLNRVSSGHFPDTVCDVIRQGGEVRYRCQFSWYCDGKSDRPRDRNAWEMAKRVADRVLTDSTDPTGRAIYYHALYMLPSWAVRMEHTVTLGTHKFYKERRR